MAFSIADRSEIEELADILDERGLTEIEVEGDGRRIRVARAAAPLSVGAVQSAAAAGGQEQAVEVEPRDARAPASGTSIVSPMVGTFYVASSPDAAPFVSVGDRVQKGQVVCIIEAMKLMNEIESEFEGVVAECLVENAQGVEFGQPLFRIETG